MQSGLQACSGATPPGWTAGSMAPLLTSCCSCAGAAASEAAKLVCETSCADGVSLISPDAQWKCRT